MVIDFDDFYEKLTAEPHSKKKMIRIQEAIIWSIKNEEFYYQFLLRFELANTATFIGEFETLFDNYYWCAEFFEENKKELDDWVFEILWATKWVMEHFPKYPSNELKKIDELFDWFKRNCETYGYKLRAYYQYKHRYNRLIGNSEKAQVYYERWLATERDELSDCSSCEKQQQLEFLIEQGCIKEGLRIADHILSDVKSCEDAPVLTYSKLLFPLYQLGKKEDAIKYQAKGYSLIKGTEHHLVEIAEHILFLCFVDLEGAYRVTRRHIDYARAEKDPHGQFYFYLSTWFMIKKFMEMEKSIPLNAKSFERIVRNIAHEYDFRNKNTFYEITIEKILSY